MGNFVYLAIIVVLLLVVAALALRLHHVRASLRAIAHELEQQSSPQILQHSDDPAVQDLLAALNLQLLHTQQLNANYRRTETAMRRMLSNISHDLKTPLTVVIGYLETLSHQHNLPDNTQNMLQKVHGKSLDLLKQLNSFFDLAMLESGDRQLALAPTQLNELCSQQLLSFYELLESRRFRVEINIPDTPLYAQINPEAFGRVLDNLISNAMRYGSEGQMLGFELEADQQFVRCHVIDHGAGIPAEHGERIFERLYTMDEARNTPSSGLGLSISKRLMELMGGSIRYTSQPYHETRFTLELPRYHPQHLLGKASQS